MPPAARSVCELLQRVCNFVQLTAKACRDSPVTEREFEPAASISAEAQHYFRANYSRAARDAKVYPAVEDLAGWARYNRQEIDARAAANQALIERYGADLTPRCLGEVPVLDIKPRDWRDQRKVVVYTHGGGYVGGLAADALDSTLPLAAESGLRIVSINYTLAPHAQFQHVTDETVAVIRALREQGYSAADIAIFGDSAGAGLAAATALKYRDVRRELLAAVVLWSPWADLSGSGDSCQTLAHVEPHFTFDNLLGKAALAYAGADRLRHPYASPVFGDFSRGYPPTLIQAGTRELLLSDSVRLYEALRDAQQDVVLDLYEGMWHVFQFKPIDTPEARRARQATAGFLRRRFGMTVRPQGI